MTTATAMRIELCGRLRFAVDGEPREDQLRGRQGRLLFAFLVLNRRRPVRRDELVEALWAGDGRPPSDTALAPVLSRLRGALAPATIAGRDQLALALPPGAWVDVEAARVGLTAAHALRGREAMAAGLEAATLVEAGLLPGLEASWLAEPRAALDELRVEALELAARAGLAVDPPTAERAARDAVAAAPFRESARVVLMEVLRERGNVAEAVLAFEELRVLLRDELGTTPGPEVVALQERLLGLDAAAARPASAPRAAPARPPSDLVEREDELGRIDAALAGVAAGTGGVLLFEGPAGIGKTRLLDELRARAAAEGVRVLAARAGILERDYGFGVARQLLAGAAAADPAALEGPAAPARAAVTDVAGATDGSFAVLDGLFHLTASLAANRPLVLCVDDLQWSDPASLRFAAYLTRRLGALPVLFAATVRTGEPDVDEALLAELAHDPSAVALRPAPLTADATRTLVRTRLGAEADDAFAAACHDVTAGNPLLVGQLLTALHAEHVQPDAAHAAQVRAVGPRAVSRTVLLRLARLPPAVVAVARAVAVLGEQPGLPAAAALAGTDEATAAEAVQALARAEILRGEEPLGFVHPLVRDAVYHELPAAGRGLEHARAARELARLGASPESVAAQLLLAPPRGDTWVVEHLRAASEVALARATPDAALAYLQRAHAEPPPPEVRTAVALELGSAAELVRGQAAVGPLREALATLGDPTARATTALQLGRMLLFLGTPQDGVTTVETALAELPEGYDDLRDGLEALRLCGVFFGVLDPSELARLEAVRRGPRGSGPGSRTLTALTALAVIVASGPAAEAAALGREALEDDTMIAFDRGLFAVPAAQAIALVDPADGLAVWEHITAFAGRRGSVLDAVGAQLWGGLTRLLAGDLPQATASLERAREGEVLFGAALSAQMGYTPAWLATSWLERGDVERAWAALAITGDHVGPSDGERFWMAARAELLLAEGRPQEVLPLAELLETRRPPETHPLWSPWRNLRGRALALLGRDDEAITLLADELALARRIDADWLVGRGLRLLGELEGAEGSARLREAVALLDGTSARLERAKAHAALARVAGGEEATAARATAVTLAEECGAEGLAAGLRAA